MTLHNDPLAAVDDLATLRAEMAALKARELELCDEIRSCATALDAEQVTGLALDARIETRQRMRIDPARLPAEILGNPRFYETCDETCILLWPKVAESSAATVEGATVSAPMSEAEPTEPQADDAADNFALTDAVARVEEPTETAPEAATHGEIDGIDGTETLADHDAPADEAETMADPSDIALDASETVETEALDSAPFTESAADDDITDFEPELSDAAPDMPVETLDMTGDEAIDMPDIDAPAMEVSDDADELDALEPADMAFEDIGETLETAAPVEDAPTEEFATGLMADAEVAIIDPVDTPADETLDLGTPVAPSAERSTQDVIAELEQAFADVPDVAAPEAEAPTALDLTDTESGGITEAPTLDISADTASEMVSDMDADTGTDMPLADIDSDFGGAEMATDDAFADASPAPAADDFVFTADTASAPDDAPEGAMDAIAEMAAPQDLKPTEHAELQPLAGLNEEEVAIAADDLDTALDAPAQEPELERAADLEAQADALFAARLAMENGGAAFERTTAALSDALGTSAATGTADDGPREGDFADVLSNLDEADDDAQENAFVTRRAVGAPS